MGPLRSLQMRLENGAGTENSASVPSNKRNAKITPRCDAMQCDAVRCDAMQGDAMPSARGGTFNFPGHSREFPAQDVPKKRAIFRLACFAGVTPRQRYSGRKYAEKPRDSER